MELAGYVEIDDRWLVLSRKLVNAVFHNIVTRLT